MKQIIAATFIFIVSNKAFEIWGLTNWTIGLGAVVTVFVMIIALPLGPFRWPIRKTAISFPRVPFSPEGLLPFLIPTTCTSYLLFLTYWLNTSPLFEDQVFNFEGYFLVYSAAVFGMLIIAALTIFSVNLFWAPIWTIGFAAVILGGICIVTGVVLFVATLVLELQFTPWFLLASAAGLLVGFLGLLVLLIAGWVSPSHERHLCFPPFS